ncbi:MAG: RepB family plasmid replication initiator protein, partial [Butyrivibrio sp.]|nr:RepB family plasmid replication initiator protein [Butyrivibrio sp.]
NFKKFALDKAKKELNETTSIWFDYEPVKAGRGGKVVTVRFMIDVNPRMKREHVEEVLTQEEQFDRLEQAQSLIEEKLRLSDIRAILEAADYDLSRVETAYLLSRKAAGIENLTGWLIAAIRDGYEAPIRATGQDNPFEQYEQREMDFDALEQMVMES